MTFKIKGLDKFQKELERKAKNVSGNYSFDEIFTDSYIQSISKFSSLEDFLSSSPQRISTAEEFKEADKTILDKFVAEETDFATWQEMLTDAGTKLLAKKLKV